MRLRTLLKIAVVLVVAVVVAIAAVPFVVDPDDFKPEIAAQVRKATGRELVLTGAIDLRPGLRPRLALSDAALGNARWGSRAQMIRIGQFEVQVALLPLIRGEIVVDELILRDADILLETDDQGRGNWELQSAAGAPTVAEAAVPGSPPVLPGLKTVTVERGRLAYRDGRTGAERALVLDRLELTETQAGAPLTLDMDLVVDDLPVEVQGTIGHLTTLGQGPYPLDLTISALGLDVTLAGSVADPLAARGIALTVGVVGETLAGLAPVVGPVPELGPLRLSAAVNGSADAFVLDDLSLTLGASDLTGSLAFDGTGARPKLSADLTAEMLDVTQLMPARAVAAADSGTVTGGAGGAAPAGDRVFPDDPLPLAGFDAVDADVAFRAVTLVAPGARVADVEVALALADGRLSIDPLQLSYAGSRIDGTVSLDTAIAPPALSLSVRAPALDLGGILAERGHADMFEGAGTLDLAVSGGGRSVAAIMGSLSGHSRFLMGEGRVRTEGFDAVVGGLATLAGGLFGNDREWIVVNCIAEDVAFKDGLATANALVVDTELVTAFGEGTVDLKTERLDLKVSPNEKSQIVSVAIPVRIRGTLANPTFALDELAAAQRLGGALGLLVFPPAAVVGFANMGGGDNPCLKPATSTAAPEPTGTPADSAREKAEEALEDLTKDLKGLFGN